MKIFAILLVQDECDILEHVLSNASIYCDYVCVYDTGSVDGSIEIARKVEENEKAVEVIFSENVLFHEKKTRRHALSLIKDRLRPGDWVLWLDADEFIGLEVSEFRNFLKNTNANLIRHRHYNFGLNIKDLLKNPNYFKDGECFERDYYKHYLEYAYVEIKCMRWNINMFDQLLGGRDLFFATGHSSQRLPIIHYPYRNIKQMSKRLVLRNLVMEENKNEKFNKHWRVSTIKTFFIDTTHSRSKELKENTLRDDFLRMDGKIDPRFSTPKVLMIKLKQSILKISFFREFLVSRKSVNMKDELSDFKPVFKSETFNKKLKNRYDEIDTNNIFDQIVKSPGNN